MTATITGAQNADGTPNANTGLYVVSIPWTSNGSGAYSEVLAKNLTGLLLGVETNPGGTNVPTAGYNVTLTNTAGRDILGGTGATRSASATEYVQPKDSNGNITPMPLIGEALTVAISGAGASKDGVVKLYVEKR